MITENDGALGEASGRMNCLLRQPPQPQRIQKGFPGHHLDAVNEAAHRLQAHQHMAFGDAFLLKRRKSGFGA